MCANRFEITNYLLKRRTVYANLLRGQPWKFRAGIRNDVILVRYLDIANMLDRRAQEGRVRQWLREWAWPDEQAGFKRDMWDNAFYL
jgi:hypothetical protein